MTCNEPHNWFLKLAQGNLKSLTGSAKYSAKNVISLLD